MTAAPPLLVIDHLAFPHIMDAIVAYAPLASLRVLRACSRKLRNQIDRLATHIVIDSTSHGASFCNVYAPHGQRLAWFAPTKWAETRSYPAPTVLATMSDLLASVRVVDVRGTMVVGDTLDISQAFFSVDMVRYLPLDNKLIARNPICGISAPKLVVFTSLSPTPTWDGPPLNEDATFPGLMPLCPNVEKLVMNVCFYTDPEPRFMHLRPWTHPPGLKEVVIIFSQPRPQPYPWDEQAHLGTLSSVLLWMCVYLGYVRYTLVGIENIHPSYLGLPRDLPRAAMCAAVRDIIRAQIPESRTTRLSPNAIEDDMDTVTMLSLDQYRETMSEDEFTLETDFWS